MNRWHIAGRVYPPYAPRVLWQRFVVHRTLVGPLMGCSCTRCFAHPWRLYYWREGVRDRLRIAELERQMREARERPLTQAEHDARFGHLPTDGEG